MRAPPQGSTRATPPTPRANRVQLPVPTDGLGLRASQAGRLAAVNVTALDSVQIRSHQEYFGTREARHEIVLLRLAECAPLRASTPGVMCGRHPWLRPCDRDDAALRRLRACTTGQRPYSDGVGSALAAMGAVDNLQCTNTTCFRRAGDGEYMCPSHV